MEEFINDDDGQENDKALDEKKKWLFKENIRLDELRRSLEEERKLLDIQLGMLKKQQRKNAILEKQLENQKRLFDSQWQILERETRQLAIDKERFERHKIFKSLLYRILILVLIGPLGACSEPCLYASFPHSSAERKR